MRRLLVLAALFTAAAFAQPNIVSEYTYQSGQATTEARDASTATLAVMVVARVDGSTGCNNTAPTNSSGHTWTRFAYQVTAGSRYVAGWMAYGAAGSFSSTETFTNNCSAYLRWSVKTYSGTLSSSSPFDQVVYGTSTTSPLSLGPLTPTQPLSLIVSGFGGLGGVNPVAPIGLNVAAGSGSSNVAQGWGMKVGATAFSGNWTITGTPTELFGFVASFKPASTTLAQDLSFVVIPDSHYSMGNGRVTGAGGTWDLQTTWPLTYQSAFNIVAVLGTGDYWGTVDTLTNDLAATWTLGFSKYEGVMCYLSAIGNHDWHSDSPSGRDSTEFDAALGSARAHSAPGCTYGYRNVTGHKSNQWLQVDAAGRRLLFSALELFPRAADVAWWAGINDAAGNATRESIIIIHSYNKPAATPGASTLVADGDTYGPNAYTLPHGSPGPDNYSGVDLEAVLATHANVRAVFDGHWVGGLHYGYRTDTNAAGWPLHGAFLNWQDDAYQASRYVNLVRLVGKQAVIMQIQTDIDMFGSWYTLAWEPSRSLPPFAF